VFFAIPLATVVQAILTAWPRPPDQLRPQHEDAGAAAAGG
jgi:hypothetical protein